MSVYVIRHGETAWNKSYLMQGRIDIPLNQEGIKQAKKAKDEVDGEQFLKVHSNSLTKIITSQDITAMQRELISRLLQQEK